MEIMRRWLFMGLGFVGAVFVFCGWLTYRAVFCGEELASLTEWSIIQAVAAQHKNQPGDKIEIVKLDDYSVVGIPVHDSRKEVWIMLNPRNPPYYKQSPTGDYKLSKDDLKMISASGVVISTVENCLESHVEAPK